MSLQIAEDNFFKAVINMFAEGRWGQVVMRSANYFLFLDKYIMIQGFCRKNISNAINHNDVYRGEQSPLSPEVNFTNMLWALWSDKNKKSTLFPVDFITHSKIIFTFEQECSNNNNNNNNAQKR